MRNNPFLAFLWLSLLLVSSPLQALERIYMVPGESRILSSVASDDLLVSRKGTVHLQFIEAGKWRLTALKQGFVVITNSSQTSAEGDTFHVRVAKQADKPQAFPKWACQTDGFFCKGNKIVGRVFNTELYTSIRKACHSAKACIFEAALGSTYEIKAQIVLIASSTSDSWNTKPLHPKLQLPRSVEVESLISRNEAQVIATPVVRINSGKKAHLHAGGEFRYTIGASTESEEAWKKYGLEISLKYTPLSEGEGDLDYEIEIKNKESRRNLSSSRIKAISRVALNTEVLAGQLDVFRKSHGSAQSGFFAGLPIVGPLFRSSDSNLANQKILVLFTVAMAAED